jgi:PhnB protein
MAKMNPYLVFNGNCQEAMKFYRRCFGGELVLNTVGGSPVAEQMPAGMQNEILHSTLMSGDILIMASDVVGEEGYKPGNTITLNLVCQSREEVEGLFSSLSEGGAVRQPVGEEFFGTFGALTDRFGVRWMLMLLRSDDTTA